MQTTAFILDDDPVQIRLSELLIKRHRIFNHYRSFTSAFDALSYIVENYSNVNVLPNVILTDLDMPELSGWDFLDFFQSVEPLIKKRITIFVISSSVDAKAKLRLKQYPFVKASFLKPVSLITLQKITAGHSFTSQKEEVFQRVIHRH